MRFLITVLMLFTPLSAFGVEDLNLKKLEENMTLDCDKYGEDSCTARFLAMAGCTYAMGLKSDKTPFEAMDMGDRLFAAMMKGHNFNVNNMFDAEKNLKKNIRQETIERLYLCKSIIEEATVKVYKKNHSKDISPEDKNHMAKAFPWWYVDEFEKLAK